MLMNISNQLEIIKSQVRKKFPITLKEFVANISYDSFHVGEEIIIKDNIKVLTLPLNHPDGAVGYRIEYKDKAVCYITDHEHEENVKNEKLINFVSNSDLLIYDSTYRDEEFVGYKGWGHSTWQEGFRLSKYSKIKKYVIFHHNPDNKDNIMKEIEEEASLISNNIVVAKEGMSVKI